MGHCESFWRPDRLWINGSDLVIVPAAGQLNLQGNAGHLQSSDPALCSECVQAGSPSWTRFELCWPARRQRSAQSSSRSKHSRLLECCRRSPRPLCWCMRISTPSQQLRRRPLFPTSAAYRPTSRRRANFGRAHFRRTGEFFILRACTKGAEGKLQSSRAAVISPAIIHPRPSPSLGAVNFP